MTINFLLLVLGVILVLEGIPYFLFPVKVKTFYNYIKNIDESLMRTIGIVMIIAGLIMVYFIRTNIYK